MKLAIFSKIGDEIPLPQLCALLAEHGYSGVEWRVHPEGHVSPARVLDDARAADAAARRHGLESICLAGYRRTFEVEQIEAEIAAAAAIGCPHVRIWAPAYRGDVPYQELFDGARRDLECVVRTAQERGVRAVLEIHFGTIVPSAGLMHRLISGLDPSGVGVIYDPDNFVKDGREHWQLGLELLGPYLAYVQFKNSAWVPGTDPSSSSTSMRWTVAAMDLEEGLVDWPAFLGVLRRLGYDGYLSCEDGRPISLPAKLSKGRETITRLWRESVQ
jgi:sugar phosphate isomerase/epimerase